MCASALAPTHSVRFAPAASALEPAPSALAPAASKRRRSSSSTSATGCTSGSASPSVAREIRRLGLRVQSVQSGASGRSQYRRTVVGAHDTAAVTFKLGCALTFVFLACALWEVFLLPPNKAGLTGQGARLYTLSQSRRIPGYWRARGISSKYTPSSPPGPERLIVEQCNRLGSGPWPSPGTEGERERTLLTRHCACDAREAALN